MKEELDLKQDVQKGKHADRILHDPLVQEILKEMKETLMNNLESSHWEAKAEREEIYRMMRTVKDFERRLTRHSESGRLAESTLEKMKRLIRIA